MTKAMVKTKAKKPPENKVILEVRAQFVHELYDLIEMAFFEGLDEGFIDPVVEPERAEKKWKDSATRFRFHDLLKHKGHYVIVR